MNKYAEHSHAREQFFKMNHRLTLNYLTGCMTKKKFLTKEEAEDRAEEIVREGKPGKAGKKADYMRAYHCPSCGWWHLTTKRN